MAVTAVTAPFESVLRDASFHHQQAVRYRVRRRECCLVRSTRHSRFFLSQVFFREAWSRNVATRFGKLVKGFHCNERVRGCRPVTSVLHQGSEDLVHCLAQFGRRVFERLPQGVGRLAIG